jgi:dsDNA-binding SOS-regulon protein
MFSETKEISSADAYDEVMKYTQNLKAFSEIKKAEINEAFKEKNMTTCGFLTPYENLTEKEILEIIRYNDKKDINFAHLTEWFQLDIICYNPKTKQIIIWGDYHNVKETIEELKEMLTKVFEKKKQIEREELAAWRMEQDPRDKHT